MPRVSPSDLVTCAECKYHMSGKRELAQFADGNTYMSTGTCGNEKSPLYQRKLTKGFSPSTNSVHQKVQVIENASCFTENTQA